MAASLLFRSLIASRMSSSPSVAAGSKVLSVVGTCPPHDGVRGVASQCIPRSHADRELQRKRRDRQHRRPGRDDQSAPVRNTTLRSLTYAVASSLVHQNSVPSVHMQ